MKWTKVKPKSPGYYFYRDNHTDHDVIPIDYLWEDGELHYWEEWSKEWVKVDDAPPWVEWSDSPIQFPEECK